MVEVGLAFYLVDRDGRLNKSVWCRKERES